MSVCLVHDERHQISAQDVETEHGIRADIMSGSQMLDYHGKGQQRAKETKHLRGLVR